MTPDQVSLIRKSFMAASSRRPEMAERFYEHLFADDPSLKPLFKEDIRAQAAKLGAALAMVVRSLDKLDEIMGPIRALAVRHAGYGVQDHHYAVVGKALIKTLREAVGEDDFTSETEQAWATAYGALSGAMIAASKEASNSAVQAA